jgi:hypothetical protein
VTNKKADVHPFLPLPPKDFRRTFPSLVKSSSATGDGVMELHGKAFLTKLFPDIFFQG